MITTVLFDLDGTLLPMDQESFLKHYFSSISQYFRNTIEPERLIASILAACQQVLDTPQSHQTCMRRFAEAFEPLIGGDWHALEPMFERYYRQIFGALGAHFPPHPLAARIVEVLRQKGYRLIVATNPIFPRTAILKRIGWAGLRPEDFELITDYALMHASKPHSAYYREILSRIGCTPRESLMVGNDIAEDMVPADALGMRTFHLTDCAIPSAPLPQRSASGSMSDLLAFSLSLDSLEGKEDSDALAL